MDTGCGVSLVDRAWLHTLLPEVKISKISSPLKVRGVGANRHETDKFVVIPIYFPGKKIDGGTEVLAKVQRELHIVDELRAHMLVGNDIIGPERIVVDIANKSATISSCGVKIDIEPKQRGQMIKRKVHAQQAITIVPYSEVLVPIKALDGIPTDRDFMFEPKPQPALSMYTHLVDLSTSAILVTNNTDRTVQILRKAKLGAIEEIGYENCFNVSTSGPIN